MSTLANPGATLVAPVHGFDTGALAAYLRQHVDDDLGDLEIMQFQGGQSNPTYRVTAGEKRYVLRRKPPGQLLPSAHAIDREYRIMAALANTAVPVPKMHALCTDEAVIGTPFYVMEYVEGRVLWDPALPGLAPEQRAAHYEELNRVIAALHSLDYQALALADFGRPGRYVERQIARWSKQYEATDVDRIPEMDRLLHWLPGHLPESDEETTIVHGDYRLDNVIFHPKEPRIVAVLDWELATLGHPASDFAYHLMAWRLSPEVFRGLGQRDLRALGIPPEQAYVARYCERTKRDEIAHLEYYVIFNLFRIAAILHGVLVRAIQGNAASGNALEQGSRARRIAAVAWDMARRFP